MLFAGGGIRGGNVIGASDRICAYPAELPVGRPTSWPRSITPWASARETLMHDPLGRPLVICEGHVISQLF